MIPMIGKFNVIAKIDLNFMIGIYKPIEYS